MNKLVLCLFDNKFVARNTNPKAHSLALKNPCGFLVPRKLNVFLVLPSAPFGTLAPGLVIGSKLVYIKVC